MIKIIFTFSFLLFLANFTNSQLCFFGISNCLNGGTCNKENGACTCVSGFTGPTCNLLLYCNAGGPYKCLNGRSCNAFSNSVGYYCACLPGFTDPTCSTAIGCGSGGSLTCLNGGTFDQSKCSCKCVPSFTGNYRRINCFFFIIYFKCVLRVSMRNFNLR